MFCDPGGTEGSQWPKENWEAPSQVGIKQVEEAAKKKQFKTL